MDRREGYSVISARRLTVAPNTSRAVTQRIEIEQGIARGETVIDMCRRLRVAEDDVCAVWLRMDRINETGDTDLPRGRPRTAYRRGKKGPRPEAPCGTRAAFDRHRRRGEDIDAACIDAERVYQAARWRRRSSTRRGGAA